MSNQNTRKTKSKSTSEAIKFITPSDLNIERPGKVSKSGFSVSIRALLQNWRQGTVGCKTRAEVGYSNKKPWKQKGTGRARAGSRRSPIWVGGGIIFGPQPRVRKLKVNKSLRKGVMNNMIWNLLDSQRVLSLDFNSQEPKTSQAFKLLKDNNLNDKKLVLLTTSSDFVAHASFGNLPNVRILLFDEVNSFDMASGESLVFLNKDFDTFKETVLKWI